MSSVAFFVDGNFLFQKLKTFKCFYLNGDNLVSYCKKHLQQDETLYRIFYYDAPPLERKVTTPLGNSVDFGTTDAAQHMRKRFESLQNTPYIALRLGHVSWQNDWLLTDEAIKRLIANKTLDNISDRDFKANLRQKAVDMKIGLDIATVAFKKQASRIVIIAGDIDFAPATKLARTEGLHVTLDTFGQKAPLELLKHVDWCASPISEADIKNNLQHFVAPTKTIK
jgi:uncharacterized LabA/DUF88 family protein